MRVISNPFSILFLTALIAFTGCDGLTNRGDAIAVQDFSSTNSLSSATQCHFTTYMAEVQSIVLSQCASCHLSAGNGSLLLVSGNSDAVNQNNFALISSYIETGSATPNETSLIGRVSGSLSHPLKLSAGTSLTALLDFTQGTLSDPTCGTSTVDSTPTPSSGGDGFTE
jgi:hypothetical protein